MRIRKAGKEDFVELHKLFLSIFPNAKARIGERDEFLIAEERGEMTGFAHFSEDEKRIILKGLGVGEKSRKRGAGGALLDRLIAHAKKRKKSVYLKARIRNPALKLYCKKGFCFKRLKGETLTMVYRIPN